MKNPEVDRIKAKLKLWETPGFSQFLTDLIDYSGPHCSILNNINVIKMNYKSRLKELEQQKSKFKQGKLNL